MSIFSIAMWFALGLMVVFIAVVAGLIAFGGGSPPPNMASINAPFKDVDFSDLPAAEQIGDLSTLIYRGGDEVVVIAYHGSSARGRSLHPLAKALREAGASVYAPDLPGHGDSGTQGDVESLSVFYRALDTLKQDVRRRHPSAHLVSLGFSSGGAVALRGAGLTDTPVESAPADALVLVAPMLGPFAPTTVAENPFATEDKWAKPYLNRILGLSIANSVGIRAFDGLPVIGFAIERDVGLTGEYSHRLLNAMNTTDYAADLLATPSSVTVVVGEKDEVFHAASYAPTLDAVRTDIDVIIVPEMGHTGITVQPEGIAAIVEAVMP